MGTIIFALGMTALFTPKIYKFMSYVTDFDGIEDIELDIDESEVEPIDPDLL